MKKLLTNIFLILILFTIALFLVPTLHHSIYSNNLLIEGPIIFYTAILFIIFFSLIISLVILESHEKHNKTIKSNIKN